MSNEVDLRELAVDRGESTPVYGRRHIITRYALPAMLIIGFVSMIGWSSRAWVFPPQEVTVIPVFASASDVSAEGTPLFQAAGWIEPRPTPIRVAALAQGVVDTLMVVEDQQVSKGDAVAQLVRDDAKLLLDAANADRELRLAEVQEAKASLAAAKTRYEQPVHLQAAMNEAEASLARVNTELKNLPFQVRRAEADYVAMKRDYEGKESAKEVVSAIKIDIAKSKADASKATLDEFQDRFKSLEKEQQALKSRSQALRTQLELLADEKKAVDEANARISAANARVQQTNVAVAEAELRLKRMTIVAPVDGRVFRLIAHPGARIGSGMNQLVGQDGSTVITMYQPNMLQVRVDVRFEDIPNVSANQPVEINNPALDSPLIANVLRISSEADIQKNTLQVKVAIPDPPPVFKPEMLVDVTFLAPPQSVQPTGDTTSRQRLFVLQQLIHTDDGGDFVWVADQSENTARKRYVTKGRAVAGELVEITNGLNVASRIITSDADNLADGSRIRVTGEDRMLGRQSKGATP